MMMVGVIILLALVAYWLWCNLYVARTFSAEEMHEEFVVEQCLVGKVLCNVFYWLAWLMKKNSKRVLTY
jgi:hypothetical protein